MAVGFSFGWLATEQSAGVYAGGQKVLAIGVYPAVGLKEARTGRQDAKRLLSDGIDPTSAKKQAKAAQASFAANTSQAIGAELVDKKRWEGKLQTPSASRNGC
jgi:Arm DNA-binding domain